MQAGLREVRARGRGGRCDCTRKTHERNTVSGLNRRWRRHHRWSRDRRVYLCRIGSSAGDSYKRRLILCYKYMIAFYRLEELYTQMLASQDRSANSIKVEMRRKLRESGTDSPSEDATPQKCERGMQDLA